MAADSVPRLGAGDIEIILRTADGRSEERLTLKPSYHAMRTVSARYGGLMKAMDRVAALDVEAVTDIINLGMGFGTQTRRGPKDLAERVYHTGLTDDTGGLPERCILYLRVLMSGGQLPRDDEEARDDTDRPPTEP